MISSNQPEAKGFWLLAKIKNCSHYLAYICLQCNKNNSDLLRARYSKIVINPTHLKHFNFPQNMLKWFFLGFLNKPLTSFNSNQVLGNISILSGFDPFYSQRLSFLCSSVFKSDWNIGLAGLLFQIVLSRPAKQKLSTPNLSVQDLICHDMFCSKSAFTSTLLQKGKQ